MEAGIVEFGGVSKWFFSFIRGMGSLEGQGFSNTAEALPGGREVESMKIMTTLPRGNSPKPQVGCSLCLLVCLADGWAGSLVVKELNLLTPGFWTPCLQHYEK